MKKINILLIFAAFSTLANSQTVESNSINSSINLNNQKNYLSSEANFLSEKNNKINKDQIVDLYEIEVSKKISLKEYDLKKYSKLMVEQINKSNSQDKFNHDQYLLLVDSNEKKQLIFLVFYDYQKNNFEFIGGSKISSGQKNRVGYFITPTGVFENTTDHMSYRALGTKNEHGIMGLGRKGMRVYDFGWTPATRGWGNGQLQNIRFAMHATDPNFLEARLGKPASQGCIRIHSSFNLFIDKYGLLDKHYEANPGSHWVLLKDRTPAKDQGSLLIVVNSQENKI